MTRLGRHSGTEFTLLQLVELFPDEAVVVVWVESIMWPFGHKCPRCDGKDMYKGTHKTMPYGCHPFKRLFSTRTSTAMQCSKSPLKKSAHSVYRELTSSKGVSRMKLYRDLEIRGDMTWHLLRRIRTAFIQELANELAGPVEVDESYISVLEKSKYDSTKLKASREMVGKTAVAGMKDRGAIQMETQVAEKTTATALRGFVYTISEVGMEVYTDDVQAYEGMFGAQQTTVKCSMGRYVDGHVSVNGTESVWATLKREYRGFYHHTSEKPLPSYVTRFEASIMCSARTRWIKSSSWWQVWWSGDLICKELVA